jgi:signal recognition particle receptor subunit beta
MNIMKIPLVMQWNKRDLAKEGVPLMSVEEMQHAYNRQLKAPAFSASAVSGHGVNDTLKTCLILTLKSLKKEAGWE